MNFQNATFWVFYDGQCRYCQTWARRLSPTLTRRNIRLAPLQHPAVRTRRGGAPDDPLTEMKVLTRDDRILGGIDALLYLFRAIPWLYPLFLLGSIPPIHWLSDRLYRQLAAHRHCFGGRCRLPDNLGEEKEKWLT